MNVYKVVIRRKDSDGGWKHFEYFFAGECIAEAATNADDWVEETFKPIDDAPIRSIGHVGEFVEFVKETTGGNNG